MVCWIYSSCCKLHAVSWDLIAFNVQRLNAMYTTPTVDIPVGPAANGRLKGGSGSGAVSFNMHRPRTYFACVICGRSFPSAVLWKSDGFSLQLLCGRNRCLEGPPDESPPVFLDWTLFSLRKRMTRINIGLPT